MQNCLSLESIIFLFCYKHSNSSYSKDELMRCFLDISEADEADNFHYSRNDEKYELVLNKICNELNSLGNSKKMNFKTGTVDQYWEDSLDIPYNNINIPKYIKKANTRVYEIHFDGTEIIKAYNSYLKNYFKDNVNSNRKDLFGKQFGDLFEKFDKQKKRKIHINMKTLQQLYKEGIGCIECLEFMLDKKYIDISFENEQTLLDEFMENINLKGNNGLKIICTMKNYPKYKISPQKSKDKVVGILIDNKPICNYISQGNRKLLLNIYNNNEWHETSDNVYNLNKRIKNFLMDNGLFPYENLIVYADTDKEKGKTTYYQFNTKSYELE